MSDDSNTLPLSDVTLERARMENDTIDEQFSDLEQRVATLEDEKASAEADLETVRDEKQALEDVVAAYRDQRRDDYIADIRGTIEAAAVDADDLDIDLASLEDKNLDTLETTADLVSATVEAAGVGDANANANVDNRDDDPDLSGVESGEGGPDVDALAREQAEALGVADAWEKLQAGEPLADGPQAINAGNNTENDALDELASIVAEASDR